MSSERYIRKLKELEEAEKAWEYEQQILDKEIALNAKKAKYHKPLFKISTTKLIMLYIFLNCTVVEIYSMWAMIKLSDLSALYSLIAAVVGETISFAVYAVKSTKENTKDGIIFEKMKLDHENPLQSLIDTPPVDSGDSTGVG